MSVAQILEILSRKSVLIPLTSAASAAAGGGGVYILLHKTLNAKYQALADEEIDKVRKYYAMTRKDGVYSSPERLLKAIREEEEEQKEEEEAYDEIVEAAGYLKRLEETEEVETVEPEVRNIFAFNSKTVVKTGEVEKMDKPYVISKEAFENEESQYPQSSLTYFEGDDILVDENDEVIDNTNYVVGDDNLMRFGKLSHDNNIVFIRNDVIESEFEVVKSKGHYTKEILGFEENVSQAPKIKKFRSDDG